MRYIIRKETGHLYTEAVNALGKKSSKYNCSQSKEYILREYKGVCAYCESVPGISAYWEVEHFYPKKTGNGIPPSYSKNIRNLHFSCKRCNNLKGTKLDTILSPNYYKDDPKNYKESWKGNGLSSERLFYSQIRYSGYMLIPNPKSNLAKNTVDIFHLNDAEIRGALIEDRLRCYGRATIILDIIVLKTKDIIHQKVNGCEKEYERQQLKDILFYANQLLSMMRHGEPYSQMILDNFYTPLDKLFTTLAGNYNVSY